MFSISMITHCIIFLTLDFPCESIFDLYCLSFLALVFTIISLNHSVCLFRWIAVFHSETSKVILWFSWCWYMINVIIRNTLSTSFKTVTIFSFGFSHQLSCFITWVKFISNRLSTVIKWNSIWTFISKCIYWITYYFPLVFTAYS